MPANYTNRHEWKRWAEMALVALPLLAACAPAGDASSASSAAAEQPAQTQPVTLALQVPSAGWTLQPVAAYRLPDAIWTIHQLHPPDGMAAQVISEVSDTVQLPASDLPVQRYVLGKTWNWNANPDVTFIDSLESLRPQLENAEKLPLDSDR